MRQFFSDARGNAKLMINSFLPDQVLIFYCATNSGLGFNTCFVLFTWGTPLLYQYNGFY